MRILSGVQPAGKLHLGNYFGAIRQFVELQHQGEGFYFIADLHALTTVRDPADGSSSREPYLPEFTGIVEFLLCSCGQR